MLEHQNEIPLKPKRTIIIGAGGFVGGAIARQLVADQVAVLPLTRKEVDLLSEDAVPKLKGLLRPGDSVVMVSAIAPAKTVPVLMQNLRMVEAACAAISQVDIAHLLYISSDAVYTDHAHPVTECSHLGPSTIHGMMHAARELMLKNTSHAPVTMLRPTLLYGGADPHNGYGPNRFRRQAARGEPIVIFGEGEERRDHVFIDDVAKLASLVLWHRSAGALNIATGVSTSFSRIANMVMKQFPGSVVKSLPRDGPPPHLLHRHFDISGCLKAFPMFHYTQLEKGLALSKGGV
jgi:nucleoside-diphosphate-sugar epimerase